MVITYITQRGYSCHGDKGVKVQKPMNIHVVYIVKEMSYFSIFQMILGQAINLTLYELQSLFSVELCISYILVKVQKSLTSINSYSVQR